MPVKPAGLFALFLCLLFNEGKQVLQTCQMSEASLKPLTLQLEGRANIRSQDCSCAIALH